ncbi:glycoside hydrolase family protein [Comamonas terrigena]|uniref:glycoside hydrolase family protein n=1 Tax=Comamonas terrigena TaxID=32013 RepID=UPI002446A6CB|nr:lysozyme [Comamonas terrigena]MDH0048596.1 lysozyme [Comamonas terrigena]MDH0511576.1 lysozyme [Comamonas terrigena]MDH1090965.1 lysozyme [Comamonas terrigena]
MPLHHRPPRISLVLGRMRGAVKPRVLVAALSLSAAGFVGLATKEGYTDKAIVPTQGDRPTLGFGSTFHEDGTPVKLGEVTSPVRALVKAQAHLSAEEAKFRDSLPGVALSQAEYDLYMDFVYQYGNAAWAKSSMRTHLQAGRYEPACNALLLYKYSAGYDCSTPGNKRCAGVWTRQQQRHAQCMAAIQAAG